MSKSLEIAGRAIGPGQPPYVIAELSGNHHGNLKRALSLIDAAREAGADAVKIQTYTPDTITIDHQGPGFKLPEGTWAGRTLYALYREAHTPYDWHEQMFDHARNAGITLFSSPFDPTAVDLLEGLGAPAYKVASFEVVDLPLIRLIGKTGKPVIISTGLATLEEIEDAVAAVGDVERTIVMHCVSGYPSSPAEANLLTIPDLAERFGTAVGLSDHTLAPAVAVTAVALGAAVIEKHLILDRSQGGPDASFSLEPSQFARLVADCRDAWLARGTADYSVKPSEEPNRSLRRSLYVIAHINKGEELTADNVRSIRPGLGLAPKHLDDVLGKKATRDLDRGTPLSLDDVADK